jgi:hypothetical protein
LALKKRLAYKLRTVYRYPPLITICTYCRLGNGALTAVRLMLDRVFKGPDDELVVAAAVMLCTEVAVIVVGVAAVAVVTVVDAVLAVTTVGASSTAAAITAS